jgi:hypothetical protein
MADRLSRRWHRSFTLPAAIATRSRVGARRALPIGALPA